MSDRCENGPERRRAAARRREGRQADPSDPRRAQRRRRVRLRRPAGQHRVLRQAGSAPRRSQDRADVEVRAEAARRGFARLRDALRGHGVQRRREVPLEKVLQPKVEAEVALVLERDLDREQVTLPT